VTTGRSDSNETKVAFVTIFCPHYRIKTFETFNRYFKAIFYFFSAGEEWYWQQEQGVHTGDFQYEYLPGIRLGETRITPSLLWKLWRGKYDIYLKCINGRFALPITFLIARLKRKPFVLWTGIWMRLQTPVHRMMFPLTRYIYRHSDAVVVYGEHVRSYLISEGVSADKIFVAPHSVDNGAYDREVTDKEKEALREELGVPANQKILLYLGRLEEVKGLDYLITALESIKGHDIVLILAGKGTQRSHLEQLVREKNLTDKIRFPGYVTPEESIIYYSIAWVFILPSVTTAQGKELWGLVVNEAFNQGVPVIATEAVGAAAGGLIENFVNGLIVRERDSRGLENAITLLLEDPSMRERMSDNARRSVSDWNNETMVAGFRQAVEYAVSRQ
jgi:glycosyltransferase involved in cell wall biosynthesis